MDKFVLDHSIYFGFVCFVFFNVCAYAPVCVSAGEEFFDLQEVKCFY